MPKGVKVNITNTSVDFPPGTNPVDHVQVTLQGGNPANHYTQSVPPGSTTATFAAPVTPDTYGVTVQAVDASNNVLATKTDSIVVPPDPPVTLTVPGSISEVLV